MRSPIDLHIVFVTSSSTSVSGAYLRSSKRQYSPWFITIVPAGGALFIKAVIMSSSRGLFKLPFSPLTLQRVTEIPPNFLVGTSSSPSSSSCSHDKDKASALSMSGSSCSVSFSPGFVLMPRDPPSSSSPF